MQRGNPGALPAQDEPRWMGMLRIPTYLAPSQIPGAGLGLYCRDLVREGTLVWRLDPGLDVILHRLPDEPVLRRFVQV